MPLILGTNSIKDTGYDVDNSCRFNDGDSAYMHKTFGTGGSTTAWTMSMWVKRGVLGTDQRVFSCDDSSDGDPDNYWRFKSDDTLQVNIYNSSAIGNLVTNRKFRDCSSWYHVCVIWKSGDSTSTDRLQLWVNGTRETSFSATTFPSQNANSITASQVIAVGRRNYAGEQHFDGYLAEVVFLDGVTASPVDTLGEFDSDSPTIFKPKDPSGLSFGSTGFYLDFEDSANLGNDKNGGTDLTETNLAATDQTTDTPTLNYMTLNPVAAGVGDVNRIPTFSEGNTKFTAAGSDTFYQAISTFGVSTGSWYFEVKVASDQDLDKLRVGYWNIDKTVSSGEIQDVSAANSHVFYMNKDGGEMRLNTTATTADYGTFADDELMGVAIDMDAQTITILKANSVIVNAYDYSGGIAAGTVLTPAFMGYDDTAFQVNFGNPHEANSSDAADENGYGAFEFAPPSGYLAFNSANLGSDGG